MFYWDGERWAHEPGTKPIRRASRSRLRRISDWILTVAAALGLLALALPFASVDAKTPSISVAPGAGLVGDAIAVAGTGFAPHTQLQLTWDESPTSVPLMTSNGQGQFTASFTIPSASVGPHTVAAMEVSATGGGRLPKSTRAGTLIVAVSFSVYSAIASVGPASAITSSPMPTVSPQVTATPLPTASPQVTATPLPTASPGVSATPLPTVTPVAPTPTPVPATPVPLSSSLPKLLFGLGPEVDSAAVARLTRETPINLLSAWYNGPGDLGWITDAYHQSMYDQQYATGRSLHLIVWTGDPEGAVSTKYGPACGRAYPLSDRFLTDMKQVAGAFAGSGTLYVTLFTEFQTYPCTDNAWNPNAAVNTYYRALKDRYLEARQVIQQSAPNARVSLGWGGWQTRWDDPAIGGGRSMFSYFADVMAASDFQSFQAMQSDTNVADITAMVNVLNDYGPVMLAHYKPNNGSQVVYDADLATMLTDSYLTKLTGAGLFAWSFMDQAILTASETSYQFVKAAVLRYGN